MSKRGDRSRRSRRVARRKRVAKRRDERAVLLADESTESSKAAIKLTVADVPFALVPAEGSGPVLFSEGRTFRGLERIERFIEEKKTGHG